MNDWEKFEISGCIGTLRGIANVLKENGPMSEDMLRWLGDQVAEVERKLSEVAGIKH